MTRVFNFSAGPAVLPEPVLRTAADEMTRALAERTWSELRDLLADLPAIRLAPQARPPGPPVPSRGRCPGASHRP